MSGFPVPALCQFYMTAALFDGGVNTQSFYTVADDIFFPTLQVAMGGLTYTGATATTALSAPVTPFSLSVTGKLTSIANSAAVTAGSLTVTGASIFANLAAPITHASLTITGYSTSIASVAALTAGSLTVTGASTFANLAASISPLSLSVTGASQYWYWTGSLAVTSSTLTIAGKTVWANPSAIVSVAALSIAGQTITVDTATPFGVASMHCLGDDLTLYGWILEDHAASTWSRLAQASEYRLHFDDSGLSWDGQTDLYDSAATTYDANLVYDLDAPDDWDEALWVEQGEQATVWTRLNTG